MEVKHDLLRYDVKSLKRDGHISEELRCRLGIKSISEVMRTDIVCWFDYVENKDEYD